MSVATVVVLMFTGGGSEFNFIIQMTFASVIFFNGLTVLYLLSDQHNEQQHEQYLNNEHEHRKTLSINSKEKVLRRN